MINLQQNRMRSPLPSTLIEVEINFPYNATTQNESFILYDSGNNDPARPLLFFTIENIKLCKTT